MDRKDENTKQVQALFQELMSREAQYMARVCAGIYSGNAEMQRELMQQASYELIQALHSWQRKHGTEPMPQSYFHGIWQNLCKCHYNHHCIHQQRHSPLPPQLDIRDEETVSHLQPLYNIMDRLPAADCAFIELYCQCPNISAVAQQLGITPHQASQKLYRITQKMKRMKDQISDN